MAEMFNFKTLPKAPEEANEDNIRINIKQVQKFYKDKKIPEGLTFHFSDLQSKTHSCKNGLVIISWKAGYRPKNLAKSYPNASNVVEAFHHPEEFLGRLIRSYEVIEEHANKYNAKIERDNNL